MMAVPAENPVTMPEVPILAIAGLLLLHAPPVVASLNEVVNPGHVAAKPVIVAGGGFTNTAVEILQPVPSV